MFTIGANLDEETLPSKKPKNVTKNLQIISQKEHQLVFTFEKRNGKPVTLVGRFYLDEKEKKELLKLLKKKLGTGGTINKEWIEIQGDKKTDIIKVLENAGWKFRKK
jgi:translation initiation factor 1